MPIFVEKRSGCSGCFGDFVGMLVIIWALWYMLGNFTGNPTQHDESQPASLTAKQNVDSRHK